MEESQRQGQDRSSSASNSSLISHPESPKDETVVSDQTEAQNASRSQTPVNSDQTYYYGGYNDGSINWANNMQIMPPIYTDSSSLLFHPAYGFDPQVAYSPYSPVMIDGQLYSQQVHYLHLIIPAHFLKWVRHISRHGSRGCW
ncbi:uncharacterized protein LOC143593703 [Bidens hawaiensis]|uniref:uncharacterized protein LOC143593703 n=1 Tax=Bidens hawaiensis TaxID=980011 RepID=UPI004049F9D9